MGHRRGEPLSTATPKNYERDMITWPLQPLELVRISACVAPVAVGCLAAGVLALRRGMLAAERLWSSLAVAAVTLIGVCLLASLLLWAMTVL